MIVGVSASKAAVVVAETSGNGDSFSIAGITSIPFQIQAGEDLSDLLRRLTALFTRGGGGTVALLASSSGRFKSSVEAIKAEAITELAAFQTGLPMIKVTASSLTKSLGCAKGQTWQHRAAELFNAHDQHQFWSRAAAGAASAAFKVAADFGKTPPEPAANPVDGATDVDRI